MSIKVSVSVWNMFLEAVLTHPVYVPISLGCLYFGISDSTVLNTTTGTGVMAYLAPGMYCFSHQSLKLAVNMILNIWGGQCLHCQPLKTVII
jgi:hypothetical protein